MNREFAPPDPIFRVRDNGLVPKSRYTSPEFMRLEWERVWTRTWLMACREADIPNVGDQWVFELGDESILIVREKPDSVRAFYNVCMHRGTRLRQNRCGHSARIHCPYHGWTWKLDGTIDRIPDRETFGDLDASSVALGDVSCASALGFVWVRMDKDGPSLSEFLGQMPVQLAPYQLDRHALVRDVTIEWDVNWKLWMDNSSESYHVQTLHPQLLDLLEDRAEKFVYDGVHSAFQVRMGTPSHRLSDRISLREGLKGILRRAGFDPALLAGDASAARAALQQAWRKRLIAESIDYPELSDDALVDNYHAHIFPNLSINIMLPGYWLFKARPHPTDPSKTYFDFQDYERLGSRTAAPPRPEHQFISASESSKLDQVFGQDSTIIPFVQRGMRSRGFEYLVLGSQEARLLHMHRMIDQLIYT